MLIKETSKLKPGDVIDWEIMGMEEDTLQTGSRPRILKVKAVCVQVFSHHVLFKTINKPNLKIDIQNVDLWRKGIYKQSDILQPFALKVGDV